MKQEQPPVVETKEVVQTEEKINEAENHPSIMEESLNNFFKDFKKENEGYIKGGTVGAVILGFEGKFKDFINTEKNINKNSTEYIHTLIGLILRDFDNISTKRKYVIMLDEGKDEEVREAIGKYLLKLPSSLDE